MKIKSITISGMHNVVMPKTYNFKDINYLIGKNGAGKSTVLQAIQLAVLGYIPGTDKRVSEIFNHCPSRAMVVDLRLTDDDIVTDSSKETVRILRNWSIKGRNIQSDVTVTPEDFEVSSLFSQIELPIFNFNDFLKLSRNQLKSWFLNFLPEPECKIDWKAEFEKTLLESGYILSDPGYLDEVIKEGVRGDSGLSSVVQTNAGLKELLAVKKIDVARLEGAVSALIFYEDVSTEDYESSKEEILRCLQDIRDMRKRASSAASKKSLNDQLLRRIEKDRASLVDESLIEEDTVIVDSFEKNESNLIVDLEVAESGLELARAKSSEISASIAEKQKITTGKGICPYTQHECYEIQAYIEKLNEEIKSLEEELSESKNRESKFRESADSARKQLSDLRSSYSASKSRITFNKNAIAEIQDAESRISSLTEEEEKALNPDMSWDDLDTEERLLQERLSKLEANKVYETKIKSITANKYKAENELEALKILIKRTDANGMQTEIAQLPFAEFAEEMNKIIPELFGENVKFNLNLESKANSFSFGITKYSANSEIYVPYDLMSSGEKTLLAFVMMTYIVKQSSAKLKLVMIDDMLDHLDDSNIAMLFEKFANSDVQIINAGVKSIESDSVNIIEI